MKKICDGSDLIVFSHLRWDFVFQRPQHLISRFAQYRRVYFFEEPIFVEKSQAFLEMRESQHKVFIVTPHLPENLRNEGSSLVLAGLLSKLMLEEAIRRYSLWYYTPMAVPFTSQLNPQVVIYDCMDELANFKAAPPGLLENETKLFRKADLVFTGGQSLYESKRHRHPRVYAFPSSIDRAHFAQARESLTEPEDQKTITGVKLGYFGVIDERIDLDLIEQVASLRPQWNIIMLGPVVKIDPETLPKNPNIHYLGRKDYTELPSYVAHWDAALMPFARNESTRFISPTKTPEYLAAGRAVVSTSIQDVVDPYHKNKLVYIADEPEDFVRCAEQAMQDQKSNQEWLCSVDRFLTNMSWDHTWRKMAALELEFLISERESAKKVSGLDFPLRASSGTF